MVIALYAFLGWALYTLWRDLKFHSHILTSQKTPPLGIVMDGDPETAKKSFTKNEIVIGRDPSCDICLSEQIISARHARLIYRNLHWWIEDLMSTNGTYLNDERVESPAILINGDELRIGKSILEIELMSTE